MPYEQIVAGLIDSQPVSFIGSLDENGFPAVRATLQSRKREGIRVIYFSTNTSSNKVRQFLKDPRACVYFYSPGTFRGVMLQGAMAVLETPEHKEMTWRDGDTEYYPQGVTDPDYCVLRFTAVSGRYCADFATHDFTVD